jgi:hypothetical protein
VVGLVRQPAHALAELGELAVRRHVVQRLFHRRFRQTEPLLKIVNTQHGLDCERRAASLRTRAVWLDDLHQRGPRHHTLHLFQQLALARLLDRQVLVQSDLLHGVPAVAGHGLNSCKRRTCFAHFP